MLVFLIFATVIRLKAIALLFIFAVSSFGHAIEIHYCKGEVTSIAWLTKTDCVCPTKVEKTCQHVGAEHKEEKHQEELTKQSCCETEAIPLTAKNTQVKTAVDLLPVVIICAVWDPEFFEIVQFQTDNFAPYRPPLVELDRCVHFQSFLI